MPRGSSGPRKDQVPVWAWDKFRDMSASFLTGDIQRALTYEGDLDTTEANHGMRPRDASATVPVIPEIDRSNGSKTGNTVPKFWVWTALEQARVPSLVLDARVKAMQEYAATMSSSNATAARRLAWARNYDVSAPPPVAPSPVATTPIPPSVVSPAASPAEPPASTPDYANYASGFSSRVPARLYDSLVAENGWKKTHRWNDKDADAQMPRKAREDAVRDTIIRGAWVASQRPQYMSDFRALMTTATMLGYIDGREQPSVWMFTTYRDTLEAWLAPRVVDALTKEKELTSDAMDLLMSDRVPATVPILSPDTGGVTRGIKQPSWVWRTMEQSAIPGLALSKRIQKVEETRSRDVAKMAWALNYAVHPPLSAVTTASPSPVSPAPPATTAPAVDVATTGQEAVEAALNAQDYPDKVSVKNWDGTVSDVKCRRPAVMADYLVDKWKTDEFKAVPNYSFAFAKCHPNSDVLKAKLEDPASGVPEAIRKKKIVDYVRGLRVTGRPDDLEVAKQFRDRFAEVGLFASPDELWGLSEPPPRDDVAAPDDSAAAPTTTADAKKEDEDTFWSDTNIAIAAVMGIALALIAVIVAVRSG
eukprot:jgi/Mesvir1/14669/Mv05335-RA.1